MVAFPEPVLRRGGGGVPSPDDCPVCRIGPEEEYSGSRRPVTVGVGGPVFREAKGSQKRRGIRDSEYGNGQVLSGPVNPGMKPIEQDPCAEAPDWRRKSVYCRHQVHGWCQIPFCRFFLLFWTRFFSGPIGDGCIGLAREIGSGPGCIVSRNSGKDLTALPAPLLETGIART